MWYNKHKSLNDKIDTIHNAMFDSFGYFYIKDLKGKFLYLNKNLLNAANSNMSEFLGKTDYDSPWSKYGKIYEKNDSNLSSEKKYIKVMEITETYDNKTFIILSHKKSFYHDGEIIGLYGTSLEVPEPPPFSGKPLSEDSIFFDHHRRTIVILTKKQKPVLFYLLQGLSAREVAEKMSLSKRTVEHYIEAIKNANEYTSLKEMVWSVSMV